MAAPSANNTSVGLLSLPSEIRAEILRYCLLTARVGKERWRLMSENVSDEEFSSEALHFEDPRWPRNPFLYWNFCPPKVVKDGSELGINSPTFRAGHCVQPSYQLEPAVLRVCKPLYEEGRRILYQENLFVAIRGIAMCDKNSPTFRIPVYEQVPWVWRLSLSEFEQSFTATGSTTIADSKRKPEPAVTFDITPAHEDGSLYLIPIDQLQRLIHVLRRHFAFWLWNSSGPPRIAIAVRKPENILDAQSRKLVKLPLNIVNDALPWLSCWLESISVGQKELYFGISLPGADKAMVHKQINLFQNSFRFGTPLMHDCRLALLRKSIRHIHGMFAGSGPHKDAISSLMFLVDQLIEANHHFGFHTHDQDKEYTRLMAIAAWLLAFAKPSREDFLSLEEWEGLIRHQIICSLVACHAGCPDPQYSKVWKSRLYLRAAILCDQVRMNHVTNLLLKLAVLETKPQDDNPTLRNTSTRHQGSYWVNRQLRAATGILGLSVSSMADESKRWGGQNGDIKEVTEPWAAYASLGELPDFEKLMPEVDEEYRVWRST